MLAFVVMEVYTLDYSGEKYLSKDQVLTDQGLISTNFLEANRYQLPPQPSSGSIQIETCRTKGIFLLLDLYRMHALNLLKIFNNLKNELNELVNLNYSDTYKTNSSRGVRSYKLSSKKSSETRKIVIFQ